MSQPGYAISIFSHITMLHIIYCIHSWQYPLLKIPLFGHSKQTFNLSPFFIIIQFIFGLRLQTLCLINLSVHLTTVVFTKCNPLDKLALTFLPCPSSWTGEIFSEKTMDLFWNNLIHWNDGNVKWTRTSDFKPAKTYIYICKQL